MILADAGVEEVIAWLLRAVNQLVVVMWFIFPFVVVRKANQILTELRKLNWPAELKRLEQEQARNRLKDEQTLARAREAEFEAK